MRVVDLVTPAHLAYPALTPVRWRLFPTDRRARTCSVKGVTHGISQI